MVSEWKAAIHYSFAGVIVALLWPASLGEDGKPLIPPPRAQEGKHNVKH